LGTGTCGGFDHQRCERIDQEARTPSPSKPPVSSDRAMLASDAPKMLDPGPGPRFTDASFAATPE
jgi:hypothetical protein